MERRAPKYIEPRIVYVSAEEMARLLKYAYEWRDVIADKILLIDEKTGKPDYRIKAFVEDRLTEFSLTMKYGTQVRTYTLDKVAGEIKPDPIHGAVCYSKLVNMSNEPIPVTVIDSDMNSDGKVTKPFSASPILWNNPQYEGIRIKDCFSYDINSSYAYAMCMPMPDTTKKPVAKRVQEGEIGFDLDGSLLHEGQYSLWVFPLMESPFKHFAKYYYEKKKKTKGQEHQRAKDILNLAVGYLQRKNPFLRAAIVGYANERIKSFLDKDSIYCNTDSLVSMKPRPDLKLSDEMGDFKIEHQGSFAMIGMNYQWNDENPKYRGIPNKWFLKGYDILKDGVPMNINDYSAEVKDDFKIRIIDNVRKKAL